MIISVFCGSVNAYSTDNNDTDKSKVKKTIEEFFSAYERAYDDCNKESDICSLYFSNNRSQQTANNISIIETMLYYRIIVKEECASDLSELNKTINYNYTSIIVEGNIAEVEVVITKLFHYPFCPDIESGTRDNYNITLVCESDQWKIREISNFVDDITRTQLEDQGVNLSDIDSISRYRNSIRDQVKAYFRETELMNETLAEEETTLRTTSYSGGGASQYALDYALNYNSNYADFTSYGGDCTNFVSQCMYEGGGLPMDYGSQYGTDCWFYTNSTNRSATWTGVNQLYNYIFGSSSTINASNSTWGSVGFGDLIQLLHSDGSGYHSLIISGIVYNGSGKSDLLVCAHTTDRRHVSLASYYPGTSRRYIDIYSSDL